MELFLLFSCFLYLFQFQVSATLSTEFLYPNFTASNLDFVDTDGAFLVSSNGGTFKASMFNPGDQQTRFYLCVLHTESNTILWSAGRDSPVSGSGIMSLTRDGITVRQDGSLRWSTPVIRSPVAAMKLTKTGNLVLLGQSNQTLWESFANPTDTIVIGQQLNKGIALTSAKSRDDLSTGDYRFSLTASDAILQWNNLTYWKLSMEINAFVINNYQVEFLMINQTGMYLFSQSGSAITLQLNLAPSAGFRVGRIDVSGQFMISDLSTPNQKYDFVGPSDQCKIPLACGEIGLCKSATSIDGPICSCPSGFQLNSSDATRCIPSNGSISLPFSCQNNGTLMNSSTSLSYLQLDNGVNYFANTFTLPSNYGLNVLECQEVCSQDCSCLGFFYENSTNACYKIENQFGSLMQESTDFTGFIKIVTAQETNFHSFKRDSHKGIPEVAVIVIPICGAFILIAIGVILSKRNKKSFSNYPSSDDIEVSISGLPTRFEFEELAAATENFKTMIGAGGFGTVYKGVLPDQSLVAVKRIADLGLRGKKEFFSEIAVIGNIHHVNLVKLKGYCAKRGQWLLVYEYITHGSLDKILFGRGPVLEWQERVEIAVGAARGLAYLHDGCARKIIHCDVKPENILLHDHLQAKISDFGLSKLLNREESSRFTTMRGTRGYLAPEWLTNSAISDKTDVYSFGMVLLEIVSGRRNFSSKTTNHQSQDDSSSSIKNLSASSTQGIAYFPLHALEMHEQGRYLELADSRLEGRVTREEVEKLVCVALCCLHQEPGLRPTMISVVGMLEGEIPLAKPRMESLKFLRLYGHQFAQASSRTGVMHPPHTSQY